VPLQRRLFEPRQFPRQPRFWRATAHTLAVWVREDMVTLAGGAVPNVSSLQALIWHGVPSSVNATPFEVITGISIVAGHTDFQISATGLAIFDPITFQLVEQGVSPATNTRFSARTIIPSYE
jgi:hypothetical protein